MLGMRDVRGGRVVEGQTFEQLKADDPMKLLRYAGQLTDLVLAGLTGLKLDAGVGKAESWSVVFTVREADTADLYQYVVTTGGRTDPTLKVGGGVVSRKRTAGGAAKDVVEAIFEAHARRRLYEQTGRQHAVEQPRLEKFIAAAVARSGGALSERDFQITGQGYAGRALQLNLYLLPRFTGRYHGEEYVPLPTGDADLFLEAVDLVLAARREVAELDRRRAELVRGVRAAVADLAAPAAVA